MIQAIDTLRIMDVQNHGIANQERIAIFVQQMCDLADYCLILTLPTPEGGAVPVKDHMLWFGQGVVNPGDWIFVYTAAGSTTILPNINQQPFPGFPPLRFINMHWGKDHTVFQNRALSPMLIRIGGTGRMEPTPPTYQGSVNSTAQNRLF